METLSIRISSSTDFRRPKDLRLTDNMRYFSFILIFMFFLTSCQDVERSKKPKDLIPEEKMVDVLTEMSLLQGARSYNRQELEKIGLKPDEYLWEKFDIDSSRFARSNNYYAENYVVYQRIYEKVKDSLESLKVRYDSIRERQELERDSIRTAERERGDTLNPDTINEDSRRIPLDTIVPDTGGRILPRAASQEIESRRDTL